MPTTRASTSYVAKIIISNWIISYGMPSFLLTNNRPQFVAKLSENLSLDFKVQQLTTTTYHTRTNGQTGSYTETFVARRRHYIADQQKDCDEYVQLLPYAYNMQVNMPTEITSFSPILSKQPRSLSAVVPKTSSFPGTYCYVPLRSLWLCLPARRSFWKSAWIDQCVRYRNATNKDIEKNSPALLTLEVSPFVYVNKPSQAILTSKTSKVAFASYNKLAP